MRYIEDFLKPTFAFYFLIISLFTNAQQKQPIYFTKTEICAAYPKQMTGWFDAVEHNFDFKSLPKTGKPDSLQIIVKLVVLKTGRINEIYYHSGDKSLLNPVSNLLANSGKWIPAMQGGIYVGAYRWLRLEFKFDIERNSWKFVRNPDDYNKNLKL